LLHRINTTTIFKSRKLLNKSQNGDNRVISGEIDKDISFIRTDESDRSALHVDRANFELVVNEAAVRCVV
ncbi:hypothetical protein G4B88_025539, partial [Cannabis sativa]